MKLKIFVAPTLIVLTLVVIFFLAVPKYWEIHSGVYKQYQDKKQKIVDLGEKEKNVSKLIGTLESTPNYEDTLKKYIPENQKEEQILDSLNFLSAQSGLSVYALSISDIAKGSAGDSDVATVKRFSLESDMTDAGNLASAAPSAKVFQANLGVFGSYDKIKSLIDKIYRLERFDSILSVKIYRAQSDKASDGLQADLVIKFNYLNPLSPKEAINVNNSIFSDGKFDLTIVDKIQKEMDATVGNLDNNSAVNRSNPFLP